MKPAPFEYHAPTDAKEAVELLAELGDGAKLIAGGQSLIPLLALRLASFEHLIDLRKVSGLRGISGRAGSLPGPVGSERAGFERAGSDGAGFGETVWIGAGTTEAAIGRSPRAAAKVPLLARATPLIGHFQIRNRGTIGGNLGAASPAGDCHPVLLATGAAVQARWRHARPVPAAPGWTESYRAAREAMLAAFSGTYSYSLQQTLFAMGQRVLDGQPEIAEIRLALPNKHHFEVDMSPFGLVNEGEVFWISDRPYGLIEGTVTRDDAPAAGKAW